MPPQPRYAMPPLVQAQPGPSGLGECPLCRSFALTATSAAVRVGFAAGQAIFSQGHTTGLVYRLISGATVSYRLFRDGRRQVSEFHTPGDFIGLEAGAEYPTTAEALGPVVTIPLRHSALVECAARDSRLARDLWQLSVRAFQRSEDHAMILARQGATERVCAFLLGYADRVGAGDALDLPMTRQDIGDHLGLTIHTVSRTLSQLQTAGLIEVQSTRHVRLLRRDRLEQIGR